MQWNQSKTIGLAKVSCVYCKGLGIRPIYKNRTAPCNCIFRAVFRACYNRFRSCVDQGAHASTVSLELCRGREGRKVYSRKNEEFMADFTLVAKRILDENEYKVFRFHFLLGADWKLCCQQLKRDKGDFFHTVYRIERKLGKTFLELEPYPLYPLAAYFAGVIRRESPPERRRISQTGRLPLSA